MTNATIITNGSTQIPKFPYSERIIILNSPIRDGIRNSYSRKKREKKKENLRFHTLYRKEKE